MAQRSRRAPPRPTPTPASVPDTDTTHTIPAIAILPLRLFLAITFLYAGVQKINDAGFLHPGARTYIGTQLLQFSQGSPISFVLHHLMEHAVPIGILTIFTELVVGVLVLVGLFTRLAALVGLALNFVFLLSASWHTYPYFLGADIVFVICWLTLALTGPGPFALDALVANRLRAALSARLGGFRGSLLQRVISGPMPGRGSADGQEPNIARRGISRAEALVGGASAVVLLVLGLVPRGGASSSTLLGAAGSTSTRPAPAPGGPPPASIPAGARKVGNVRQLPVNTGGTVADPKTGDPAVIVHTQGNTFFAYDAVCTHAGCTVQYDPQQRLLVCPCHGGTFDPAHGAQVVAGPPPAPLTPLDMTIDAQGNIYLV